MEGLEEWFSSVISSFGFHVEKIPESSSESPDFFVTDGSDRYLIELKTKLDSDDLVAERQEVLEKGEMYQRTTVLERTNTISGIIRKAARQLASKKDEYSADYCFICLHASGLGASEKITRYEVSLYGSKEIIHFDGGDPNIKTCYYFTNSDFFNNKEIVDGALILGDKAGRLCLNNLSPRYKGLRDSSFVAAFYDGLVDPWHKEKNGQAYVVDGDLPRNDENGVLNYIREKYGLKKVVPFNWPLFSVLTRLDTNS